MAGNLVNILQLKSAEISRNQLKSVSVGHFLQDCNWSTISAVKDEKRAAEGEGEEAHRRKWTIPMAW